MAANTPATATDTNTPGSAPKVYQALANAVKEIAAQGIGKAGRNTKEGYAYRSLEDIMNGLAETLPKYGLCIFPMYTPLETVNYQTKSGTNMTRTTLLATFTLVCTADGSSHQFTTIGEAADAGDKSVGKAQSYAFKKAIEQVFCIPFKGQDSDQDSHERGGPVEVQAPVGDIRTLRHEWKNLRELKPSQAVKLLEGRNPMQMSYPELFQLVEQLRAA